MNTSSCVAEQLAMQDAAMSVTEAIISRRSVKAFDPEHRMSDSEVHRLISLALLAPTAFNIQHWRFVVVRASALRQRIREVSMDQPQVTDASLLLVLCADVQAWTKRPERYWSHAPVAVREFVVQAIHSYYDGREQVQRDEAMRSGGIVAMTLMLAALEMGYDTCPMDLSNLEEVARLINLPPDHTVVMMLAVGKAVKTPWPRGGRLPASDVIVENSFSARA